MTISNLRFSPSILSRLGEELVPHFDQGIIELVRNAYDADASKCTVKLTDISEAGGEISIIDDGVGMSSQDIVNAWLVLGYSSKRSGGTTASGRIQVGDKGLGRLAALRMGENAKLESKPEKEKQTKIATSKSSVNIKWSDFDDINTVDEVKIETIEKDLKMPKKSGTKIRIQKLNKKITRREAERLARSLTILSNPFDDSGDFKVMLEMPEHPDLEKMVREGYLSEAEWLLKAELHNDGSATASVLDWKGDLVWETTSENWFSKKKGVNPVYNSPTAEFQLSIFNLENKSFAARSTNITQLKKWLKNLGGVHVYHNSFRVHPYGDSGFDWLDMNLARVNNPSIRPSTNNSLGQVKISDENKLLQQKTDRVGFIEGEEFIELKRFILDSLNWYARKRTSYEDKKTKAKKDKDKQDIKDSEQELADAISDIDNESQKEKLKLAVKAATKANKKRAKHLESDLNLYRSLSTAGTTSAVFSHEISKPLDEIPRVIKSADKIVKDNCKDNIIEKYLRRTKNISAYLDRLTHFAKLQLNLLKKDKRRVGVVDVYETIESLSDSFIPLLDREKIKLILELDETIRPRLNGSQSMLEAIITNCFTNSMRAFRLETAPKRDRIIQIRSHCEEKNLTLEICDSGPGIVDVSIEDIWMAGFTTMPDGTGFGLTIIKDCVSDLGGACRVVEKGSLGGASFFFEFSVL